MSKLQRIAEDAVLKGAHSAANKALELLGREIGMFSRPEETEIRLDNLSVDDLRKLAAELEADPDVIAALEEKSALALPPPRRA
jgi:hypothetical protein